MIAEIPHYFNGNRYQYTYLDYVYISCDLDNDGKLDGDTSAKGDGGDNEDIDGDGMTNKYEWDHGAYNKIGSFPFSGSEGKGGWQDPYEYNGRYAMIISGGGMSGMDSNTDGNFPAFWNDAIFLYNKLNEYKYDYNKVYLMHSHWRNEDPDHSSESCVRGSCTWDEGARDGDRGIDDKIKEIAGQITPNDFFFLYMLCHGSDNNRFSVRSAIDRGTSKIVDYTDFANFLNTQLGGKNRPKQYARMCIVIQSCYSGWALDALNGENRIIIVSSQHHQLSYTETGVKWITTPDHFAFSWEGAVLNLLTVIVPYPPFVIPVPLFGWYSGFLKSLTPGGSINDAYQKGKEAAENNGYQIDWCWVSDLHSNPNHLESSSVRMDCTYL